jgi:hypothetical protein
MKLREEDEVLDSSSLSSIRDNLEHDTGYYTTSSRDEAT